MIAYHYPPCKGASGIQRTLKFSNYLSDYGWQPIVLTVNPRAYDKQGDEQLCEIPKDVVVKRAFAFNTAKHLSIKGSYLKWMALPDRWISWWLGGIFAGLSLIYKYRPQVIWSTYPIATAHLIGLTLHCLTGIPWIADFRDSMTEEHYPKDLTTRRIYRWIEHWAVKKCVKAVFTTPGTLRMYRERYFEIPQTRWAMIANGYDEESFVAAELAVKGRTSPDSQITLLHSGLLYPWERDPSDFFTALSDLKKNGEISAANLKVILRASGNESYYRKQLKENHIEDIVQLEPAISYREALAEMLNADGLLIFQASNCNHQIPAKIYEYLRAKRPIFALTDPDGDTAALLRAVGINTIVPLNSKEQIEEGLLDFLTLVRERKAPIASTNEIEHHSRKFRTKELAELLDQVD